MLFDDIIKNTFCIYRKNIVVNLFFSALILLLPYLQYWLIKSSTSVFLSVFCVFFAAFLSVVFVYIPFAVSVHKAHITQLWKTLRRDSLILATQWAVICTLLFYAMVYLLENAALPKVCVLMCAVLMFIVWQVVILKAVNIVCNATDEGDTDVSLFSVIKNNKLFFFCVFLCGAVFMIAIPIMWGAKKQSNLAKYPEIENPTAVPPSELVLTADELTFAEIFLLIPMLVIAMHECYRVVNEENSQKN